MIKSILFLFCFVPLALFAKDIDGVYNVVGYDPITKSEYQGIAEIKLEDAKNELYGIVYQFTHPFVSTCGTGIKINNTISFVFAESDSSDLNNDTMKYGVQIYEIQREKLSGPWIFYGDNVKGSETLTKVNDIRK